MSEAPQLLVAWEGRWRGFISSLPVVLARSPGGDRGSDVLSGIPLRRPLASLVAHCAVVFAWLWLSPWFFLLFPSSIPVTPVRMIIAGTVYYFPAAFPETSDVGGAHSGIQGRFGGRHAHHSLQTIHIARGPKPVDTIVDAPKLNLPRTRERVANLLAFSGAAPAPPVDAVRHSLRQAAPLAYAPTAVAPAPDVAVKAALPTPPALAAAQFQPAPPPPIPQAEIRNSLNNPRPSDVTVAAPAISAATQAPKLILPAAGSVLPVAPSVSRRVSDVSAGWANTSASVAPPNPDGAAGPAGAAGSGSGESASESLAASSVRGGAGGHGGSAGGDGVGSEGGDAQGLIVSLNPGDKLGVPPGDANGSLAMSPAGTDVGGLGGSGGGSSIGHGSGPGNADAGAGPGSGSSGSGPGAASAALGLSPSPGPGGAGQAGGKLALVPGLAIQGGVITLPSFGASGVPSAVVAAPLGPRQVPAVVVIATSRAGGGLNAYGALHGSRVYTTYIDTAIGTAVLQYSDPASHPGFESDLTPPEPLRTELPPELKSLHVVVKFVMDKIGNLRELQLLELGDAESAKVLLAALQHWQFRPALKADRPIDVEAILGFGISTQ